MNGRQAFGLVLAVAAGVVVGACAAPERSRRELRFRVGYNARRFSFAARARARDLWQAVGAGIGMASTFIESTVGESFRPFSRSRDVTGALKRAISEDATLRERDIWVDAHGSTLLLHGVVDTDEEWRAVDTLARLASPDGSVRNLLQVRRHDEL